MRISLLIKIAVILSLLLLPCSALAALNFSINGNAPTIDGVIGEAEWRGATVMRVDDGLVHYDVYLLFDDNYIYVAFDVIGDTTESTSDLVQFYFDNGNDDTLPDNCTHTSDGRYTANYSATDAMSVMYSANSQSTLCGTTAATDAIGACSFSGNAKYEFRMGKGAPELTGTPGGSTGFQFNVYNSDVGNAKWPATSQYNDASSYGDWTFPGDAPPVFDLPWADAPPYIDGNIEDGEWDGAVVYHNLGLIPYDLYLVSDGKYLYGAADVTGDTTIEMSDSLEIMFDVDNNGLWPFSCSGEPDGMYKYRWTSPSTFELFYQTLYGNVSPVGCATTTPSYTIGASTNNNNMQYEFLVDLTGTELQGAPGDQIRALFQVYDLSFRSSDYYPNTGDMYNVASFAYMNFAESEVGNIAPAYVAVAPTIDGELGAGEWDDALRFYVAGEYDYLVYLMWDDDYLYGAVDFIGDTTLDSGDSMGIVFDNNNDGAWPATCGVSDEGVLSIYYTGSVEQTNLMRVYGSGTSCGNETPTAFTGNMSLSSKGNIQYEFSADLDGGELFGAQGATIGFGIYLTDTSPGNTNPWPHGANMSHADELTNLTYNDDDDDDDDNDDDNDDNDDNDDDDDDNDDNDDNNDNDDNDDNDTAPDDDDDSTDDDDDNNDSGSGDDDDDDCGCCG